MKKSWICLTTGIITGLIGGWILFSQITSVNAGDDRYGDYILSTGPISSGFQGFPELDGIWLLDYRSGKLLGSVVGRDGRIGSWAEVDLVSEFGIAPGADAHFMMTNGVVGRRSALYIAETGSGKLGIYTMSVAGTGALLVRRHDMVLFRNQRQVQQVEVQPEAKVNP